MTGGPVVGSRITTGIFSGVDMGAYQSIDALSSGRLDWLAVSPHSYRWFLNHPEDRPETPSLERGEALHAAVLEPEVFAATYCAEPDPAAIAPNNEKPRATKAYREAVKQLTESGLRVLKADEMEVVRGMAAGIARHPHVSQLLKRAKEREVSLVWERDGRLCRGRPDVLGQGVIADLKTCRSLHDFFPWVINRRAYYRKLAWYIDGAERLGRPIEYAFLIAVESAAPYDVGLFVLETDLIEFGRQECDRLVALLARCEESGNWPGQYPSIRQCSLADIITNAQFEAAAYAAGEEAVS